MLEISLAMTLIFFGVFLLLWWSAPRLPAGFGARWSVREVADPANLPLLALLAGLAFVVLTPLPNSLTGRNEIEADRFGLDTAREPDGFATVAMRLSEYRKLEPHPTEEAIYFTHPSGARRRMAMEWKVRHLAELPPEKRMIARPGPLPPDGKP